MLTTITDPKLDNQAANQRRSEELTKEYPALWQRIINEWKVPDLSDRAWLIYSANYLFRTGGVRWALDPLTLPWRMGGAPLANLAVDLQGLSFVLLTHRHKDHLDFDLISALRDLSVLWIVPGEMQAEVIQRTGLPRRRIVTPIENHPMELDGIRITPFEGQHWERLLNGSLKGLPAMGYQVEMNGKCWLFPGDTRTYDSSRLPAVAKADKVFAHVWLGRGSAQMKNPPLLGDFCKFILSLHPCQIILTHLQEIGREANEYWDTQHVLIVEKWLADYGSDVLVVPAFTGESVDL
jgi:L-ascorbate metabolism protein UlaG (beta-lactamase superfamily)